MVKKVIVACFLCFLFGFIVCAGLGYHFLYRSSNRTIEYYRAEQHRLEGLIEQERSYNNRERQYNTREKAILESNDTAISKLRSILNLIKEMEQDKGLHNSDLGVAGYK